MFVQKMKNSLTKPEHIKEVPSFQIISSALVAVGIIFMQGLITSEKLDSYQNQALTYFSVSIPLLSIFFIAFTFFPKKKVYVPRYITYIVVMMFLMGMIFTWFGIILVLIRVSVTASVIFGVISFLGAELIRLIRRHTSVEPDEEENPNNQTI